MWLCSFKRNPAGEQWFYCLSFRWKPTWKVNSVLCVVVHMCVKALPLSHQLPGGSEPCSSLLLSIQTKGYSLVVTIHNDLSHSTEQCIPITSGAGNEVGWGGEWPLQWCYKVHTSFEPYTALFLKRSICLQSMEYSGTKRSVEQTLCGTLTGFPESACVFWVDLFGLHVCSPAPLFETLLTAERCMFIFVVVLCQGWYMFSLSLQSSLLNELSQRLFLWGLPLWVALSSWAQRLMGNGHSFQKKFPRVCQM